MAQLVVIYRRPEDPEMFDRHYREVHVPLAMALPGLRSYQINQGPVVTVAGGWDVHLVATLQFDDLEAIRAAFASPQGQAAAADRRVLAPDDADVMMLLFDSRPA